MEHMGYISNHNWSHVMSHSVFVSRKLVVRCSLYPIGLTGLWLSKSKPCKKLPPMMMIWQPPKPRCLNIFGNGTFLNIKSDSRCLYNFGIKMGWLPCDGCQGCQKASSVPKKGGRGRPWWECWPRRRTTPKEKKPRAAKSKAKKKTDTDDEGETRS